jgi:hypothetical protein
MSPVPIVRFAHTVTPPTSCTLGIHDLDRNRAVDVEDASAVTPLPVEQMHSTPGLRPTRSEAPQRREPQPFFFAAFLTSLEAFSVGARTPRGDVTFSVLEAFSVARGARTPRGDVTLGRSSYALRIL